MLFTLNECQSETHIIIITYSLEILKSILILLHKQLALRLGLGGLILRIPRKILERKDGRLEGKAKM